MFIQKINIKVKLQRSSHFLFELYMRLFFERFACWNTAAILL